jgi:hypothetical protein
VYDPAQRRAAEELGSGHPGWLVMYGSHSRLIWAFSRFATHDGRSIVIARREQGELAELMAALERERGARLL